MSSAQPADHPADFPDFESFWEHFLTSHTSPLVRWCHVAGLACAVAGVVGARRQRRITPLILGAGGFAAFAVLSHPLFAGNWPENFGRPVWAARAFLRLCARTVTGSIPSQ